MSSGPAAVLASSRPRVQATSRTAEFIRRSVPFVVIVAIWWTLTGGLSLVPPFKLPSPNAVAESLTSNLQSGVLLEAIWSSVLRMGIGFVVGSVLGIGLGVLVGTNRFVAGFLRPLATFFQAVAGPTWIPLAVLWFGLSFLASGFIVFNTVFFLTFYTTLLGVETINVNLINSVRTLGGNQLTVIREVLLPGALPSLVNGLHVAIAYGWRALIAAEIIASGQGLGVLIWNGQKFFRVADIVLGLLLIGIISLTMDRVLLRRFERATVERWGLVQREGV